MHGFALRSDWSSDKDKKAMVSLPFHSCLYLHGVYYHQMVQTNILLQDDAAKQGIDWFSKYLS